MGGRSLSGKPKGPSVSCGLTSGSSIMRVLGLGDSLLGMLASLDAILSCPGRCLHHRLTRGRVRW